MSDKCDLCDEKAVVRAERVKNGGKNGVGIWDKRLYCDEHGRALVRETVGRYRLVHLVPMRKPKVDAGEQQAWDMP